MEGPNLNILAVFSQADDRRALRDIFRDGPQLRFASTLAELRLALAAYSFAVVITESQLRDGSRWTDVLDELQSLPSPLPLIVSDRSTDDFLWAEVLNLGAFDLLAKPFDAKEVFHAVNAARRRFSICASYCASS